MRLVISPVLESDLEVNTTLYAPIRTWLKDMSNFLDSTGLEAQAELSGEIVSDELVGRVDVYISPPLSRMRIDKEDIIWQMKYFEERFTLPDVTFSYGYGRLQE